MGLRIEIDEQRHESRRASAAPRLRTVVVLPTPPFWLKTVSRVPITDFLC